MNPIQSSETIRIIHEQMIRDVQRRNSPDGHRLTRGSAPSSGPVSAARRLTGRMLMAIGVWLAPAPQASAPSAGVISLQREGKHFSGQPTGDVHPDASDEPVASEQRRAA